MTRKFLGIKEDSLEERTVIKLFRDMKEVASFMRIEYPVIINLDEGATVNIGAEYGSDKARMLGQHVDSDLKEDLFIYYAYVVVSSEISFGVDAALQIGERNHTFTRYYSLVPASKATRD